MGCGASSKRYHQALAVRDDTAGLQCETVRWTEGDQAYAADARQQPIAAWADPGQESALSVADAWADPVQPIAAQISLGGEWYVEVSPESWHPFTPEISAQLLVAWYCGETRLEYVAGDTVYEVDFASCVQTDRSTGQQLRIGWVPSSGQEAEASSQEQQDPSQAQQPQQPPAGHADSQYQWVEYGEEEQQHLLAAWASGQTVIHYSHAGCDFEIDFTRMVETNLTTGAQRLLGVHLADEPGAEPQPALQDGPAADPAAGGLGPEAVTAGSRHEEPSPESRPTVVSDGRFPINTGQTHPGRLAGRPRTYVFKAAPDPNRQPKREKKWSLAPGQKPKNAGKAAPGGPYGQAQFPGPAGTGAPGQPRPGAAPGTAPAATAAQQLALPEGAEWPADKKARHVAETLFRDMAGTRTAALEQRKQAYKAACLSWHPDKNPKHQELATAVFQFLQALKAWYFGVA